jgi:transposase
MNAKDRILEALFNAAEPLTTKEIADHAELSYHTVMSHMKDLIEDGLLLIFPGKGNSRKYRVSNKIKKTPDGYAYSNALEDTRHNAVTKKQMWDFLNAWSQERWEPRVLKSAMNFPLAVAEMFKLAVKQAYGEKVEEFELRSCREGLNQFKRDLEAAHKAVSMVLSTEKLSDVREIGSFLLTATDVTVALRLSDDVIRLHS